MNERFVWSIINMYPLILLYQQQKLHRLFQPPATQAHESSMYLFF